MNGPKLLTAAGVALIVAAAVVATQFAEAANRDGARMALAAAGYERVEIGRRHVFGGCLNGKGGTRWRYDWTATRHGVPIHGTVCAGGLFTRPAIRDGQ